MPLERKKEKKKLELDQTEEKEHRNLTLENDKSVQRLEMRDQKITAGHNCLFPLVSQANLKRK